jgi:pimeloyl-ACP methyl ester carboxylesterase
MSSINFTERGKGNPVVLLHGFPFNHTIWDSFVNELSKLFRVITPDLPGFGKSEALPGNFTINDVAGALLTWLEKIKVKKSVIVGHSLGGYVALAMVKLKPEICSSLVLFHSTAYPDSEEKKQNRNKVLDFIGKNGVLAFTSNFIPPLFSDQQHPSIPDVKHVAIQATTEAVLGYTIAMRDRPDQRTMLKDFHEPVMIISGEKDPGIPVDSVKAQAAISKSIEVHILEDTGHMGMFEKPAVTAGLILDFASRSNRQ